MEEAKLERIPGGPFISPEDWVADIKQLKLRFILVQTLNDNFRDVWTRHRSIFLLRCCAKNGMLAQCRNLQVGDVCFFT